MQETLFDLLNEARIAKAVEKHFSLKLEKIKEKYFPLDYVLLKKDSNNVEGIIMGHAEIKARTILSTQYETAFIDLWKWKNIKEMVFATLKPVYLLYGWRDAIGIKKCEMTDKYEIRMGGRRDRGYDEYQPCIYIPVSDFTKVFEEK